MKTKDKPNKTNENQWKKMTSKEQHMKIIENQSKIKEKIRKNNENHRKTNDKPKKEQWKTMENQGQFCQHSKLLLPGTFALVFPNFPSLMGKEIRDNFEGKGKPLRCLGDWVFTKPFKYAVNGHFCCICVSNRVIFLFAVFVGYPYGGKHPGRREFSMPFFKT